MPSHSGGAPAVPPARARAAVAHSREERVCPSLIGPMRTERASELVLAPQFQRRCPAAPGVAPYRCGRSILPPHPTRHWCFSRASSHPRAAVALTPGARVSVIDGFNAHGAGLGAGAPSPELSAVASQRLALRRTGARALSFSAVPLWLCSSRASGARPRCWGSHARSACDRHRWAALYGAGLGADARSSILAPSPRAV